VPERALQVLDLVLMDERENILLLELKAECLHLVDDMENMHHLYQAISATYQQMGIHLEERANGLFQVASEDRSNIQAILELGKLMSYMYKLDHVINLLTEAARLHPEDVRIPFMAARIYRMDNKPMEAVAALQKALQLEPDHRKAALALARLQAHLGLVEDAALQGKEAP
jgi:tetratricopeptide (TPR) repeat protein